MFLEQYRQRLTRIDTMKKEKQIRKGYNMRITPEEMKMMQKLRSVYCVNVAQSIRRHIRDLFEENEKNEPKT